MEPVRKHFCKLRFWVHDAPDSEGVWWKRVLGNIEGALYEGFLLRLYLMGLLFHSDAFRFASSKIREWSNVDIFQWQNSPWK